MSHHFDGISMERLIDHQTAFLAAALSDRPFSRRRIEDAHRLLGITDGEFDEMIEILSSAMADHGVDASDRAGILDSYEGYRQPVVSRA